MSKPVAPCKTCEKREVGCHANCEGYKEYLAKRDAWVQLVVKNKNKDKEVKIGKWYR